MALVDLGQGGELFRALDLICPGIVHLGGGWVIIMTSRVCYISFSLNDANLNRSAFLTVS